MTAAAPTTTDSTPSARVTLRRPIATTGFVDAGWWPRSRDLAAELPGLLAEVRAAGRDISRVTYQLDAWAPVERKLRLDGRLIRMGGFTHQDAQMISLHDGRGSAAIDVLVVAPDSDPGVAERALELAGRTDGTMRPERIMELARTPDPAQGR